ncbi:hypothetical protein C5F49_02515 [Nitrosopumilus oxyclinae]|uniref:Glucose/Sorbosone dehydrogenase domain-containing protein n=1 Tax=Nitrosopumilus oxyclinae TaxID=1959104 RepID=A0A7D5M0X6_9ARCH|nr:PQQ-dependent sugar dehydrogenase [Nitrosopumilus oxyclinae]QLH04314.1 hypothetical protein C5F49_02515 [Nitrosopumilus oxyclinae]
MIKSNYVITILFASLIILFSQTNSAYSELFYDVNTVNFSGKPASAVVNENANVIYVTDFFAGKLVEIDGNTEKISGYINTTKTPFGVGYNPGTDLIYVGGEFANVVKVINAGTKEVEKTIQMNSPYDIAVNSENNLIYITSDRTNSVFVIDGITNEIISKLNVNKPCGIAVNEKTGNVYVTSETDDTVHVFDEKNNLIDVIQVESSPRGVAVNEITNIIYVTNQETNTVSVIDGVENTVIKSIPVGEIPRRIAIQHDANLIYVTNHASNNISVIDGETNSIVKTIPVNAPFEIVINEKTNKLYSMYYGNQAVSVIQNTNQIQDNFNSVTTSNLSNDEKKSIIPIIDTQEFPESNIKVETIADNLKIPWEIDFATDGRIFFTERVGNLRVIENGVISEPIISLKVSGTEGGLLGLALDPDFEENHYLYLYYSYNDFLDIFNRVVRYTESENTLSDETILLDRIPGSNWHDGGRIKFGPDQKLYITTGDASSYNLAQDLNSLAGKILRINSDGTIPKDNPFTDSAIFSYGHRNPQGIDWHPDSGILVASEHGPSGERGRAHDEINVIFSGKNYGWPEIIGDETSEGLENPIIHTGDDTWAPSGASFYDSDKISDWYGKYFVATLRGNHLRMLDLDLENNLVVGSEAILAGEYGRLRNANMGPDGHLYILTSNQDGRGDPAYNDDRILRITPLENNIEKEINPLAPLKQFTLGIHPSDVTCKEGLDLIFKNTSLEPACVKPPTAQKLIQYGWAVNTINK